MKLTTQATPSLDAAFQRWEAYHLSVSPAPLLSRNTSDCGLFYISKAIEECKEEWLVYLDVDCFLLDPASVAKVQYHMVSVGAQFSGVPDGGSIPIRWHNPNYPNPFFLIIWVGALKERHGPSSMVDWDLVKNDVARGSCACEAFYATFHWLLKQGSVFLPLPSRDIDIGCYPNATIVQTPWRTDLAIHTWYARNAESEQFRRIDTAINYANHYRRASTNDQGLHL